MGKNSIECCVSAGSKKLAAIALINNAVYNSNYKFNSLVKDVAVAEIA